MNDILYMIAIAIAIVTPPLVYIKLHIDSIADSIYSEIMSESHAYTAYLSDVQKDIEDLKSRLEEAELELQRLRAIINAGR